MVYSQQRLAILSHCARSNVKFAESSYITDDDGGVKDRRTKISIESARVEGYFRFKIYDIVKYTRKIH